MDKRNTKIFTFIICTFFVLVTTSYIILLTIDYNKGKANFNNNFESISKEINNSLQINSPASKEFKSSLNALILSNTNIAFLKVSYNNTIFYNYPIHNKIQNSSVLLKTMATELHTPDANNVTLTVSLYLLSPSSIYSKGKIAFILILAGTLASIIYLIIISAVPSEIKNALEKTQTEFSEEKITENIDNNISFTDFSSEENTESKKNEDTISFEEYHSPLSDNKNEHTSFNPEPIITSHDNISFIDECIDKNSNTEKESQEEISLLSQEELNNLSVSTEENKFSTVTPFMLASQLDERLTRELKKSTENEEGLSLFNIRVKNLEKTSDCAKEINSVILDTFKLRDYIFEDGDDGIFAILLNENPENAINLANKLYADINLVLQKHFQNCQIGIGLTSRCQRLVSPKRFRAEAEQALVHALENPTSPVIAFKVNVQKYREYLKNEGK